MSQNICGGVHIPVCFKSWKPLTGRVFSFSPSDTVEVNTGGTYNPRLMSLSHVATVRISRQT